LNGAHPCAEVGVNCEVGFGNTFTVPPVVSTHPKGEVAIS